VKYISLDTETGGLGLDVSLLSLGLVLADDDLNEVKHEHILIKPNNDVYKVTGKALEINGINLITHDLAAVTEKVAGSYLYDVLKDWSDNGKEKLIVIGKQVDGDINHIWNKLMSRNTWENFVSYQKIDVSGTYWTMRTIGAFPAELKGSLKDIALHYNLDITDLHDALGDARLTLKVYKEILKEIKEWRHEYFKQYVG